MTSSPPYLALVSTQGPRPVTLEHVSNDPVTIGRSLGNELVLEDPLVSRDHAIIRCEEAKGQRPRWLLIDVNSRHGTRLNGVQLEPGAAMPIREGDLVELMPWTFRVREQVTTSSRSTSVGTRDDRAAIGMTVAVKTLEPGEILHEQLHRILECAEAIHAAADDEEIAAAVLDAAVAGTRYPNAAILHPMDAEGSVEIVAHRGEVVRPDGKTHLSRSLLHEASRGVAVRLTDASQDVKGAPSIIQLSIQDAICIPLMIESTVAGFLYLDAREAIPERGRNDAESFAVGLGRLAALAMANRMRKDLASRQAQFEGELAAAAQVQQSILPADAGVFGAVSFRGTCRPGRTVSGDFFDVIPLDDHRVAVTLGDVVGKGIRASVLMATAQGFLRGAIPHHDDPADTVGALSRYVQRCCEPGDFLTLWLGIFDTQKNLLQYVDAGHGYAVSLEAGHCTWLEEGGGPPVGVVEVPYASATRVMRPGGLVVVVSDGIIEQRGHVDDPGQFGRGGVETYLRAQDGGDHVMRLFEILDAHAAGRELDDDATVVCVEWCES